MQMLVLIEEVGELASEYRQLTDRARKVGNWDRLKAEAADVYITLKVFTELLDIDLEEEVAKKMQRIAERGGI